MLRTIQFRLEARMEKEMPDCQDGIRKDFRTQNIIIINLIFMAK